MVEALIVVVNSHRQHALGMHLANDIVIQHATNLCWCRDTVTCFQACGLCLFADNIHAEFDTFITDKDGWPRNQLTHLVLAFATKATVKCVFAVVAARIRHL